MCGWSKINTHQWAITFFSNKIFSFTDISINKNVQSVLLNEMYIII